MISDLLMWCTIYINQECYVCVHTHTTVHGKEKDYTKIIVIISKSRDFLIYTFLFYFFFLSMYNFYN